MKKLLIVSPHFPPINAPDMQRVRMSLPYYREQGWEPVVLAVGEPWQDGVREDELLSSFSRDVRVVYVRAVPPRWARWFGIGNLGWRSFFPLWRAGSRLLRREKFDLVFFSTTQFVVLILGCWWRRRFGVPYVVDVQDPWRTDYYERLGSRTPPGGWKYQVARLIAWMFEGPVFRGASAVMSVSPSYLSDLSGRYPGFSGKPNAVIIFGASRSDIDHARALPEPAYRYERSRGELHFVYTGAAGPVMPHALNVLFTALRLYRGRDPERAARLRLHFLGTSYVASGKGRPSVLPIARICGVEDQVFEVPHRLGFFEVLQLQLRSDALLLLGSSDLAYSPSKVYQYYLTDRPILGVVFQNSVLKRLLEDLSCAHVAAFSENAPADEALTSIQRFFDLAFEGFPAGSLPVRNEGRFQSRYLASWLTRQQAALFQRALSGGGLRP